MFKRSISLTLLLVLVLSTLSLAQSRGRNQAAPAQPTGPVVITSGLQYELITTYDLNRLNRVLNEELTEFMSTATMKGPEFTDQFSKATYPVNLYRVRYRTVVPELGNLPTMATGLIAIPDMGAKGAQTLPVLSYQHGSVYFKEDVPSEIENSIETRLAVARFASQGYVVIAADYIGNGGSDLPSSYFIKGTTQQAMLDMYYASLDMLSTKSITMSEFFILGWSQGGWNTLAFLNKLESIGLNPTAAATAAAPTDLILLGISGVLNPRPEDAIWASYFFIEQIRAKEYYYSVPGLTASIVKEEFLEKQAKARNKEISLTEYFTTTPPEVYNIVKPEFIEASTRGTGVFYDLLRADEMFRWKVQTPLISYYGEKDEAVRVYNATQIANYSNQLGSTVKAVSAGANADHRSAYIYTLIHSKEFFDGFRK